MRATSQQRRFNLDIEGLRLEDHQNQIQRVKIAANNKNNNNNNNNSINNNNNNNNNSIIIVVVMVTVVIFTMKTLIATAIII